MRVLLNQCHFIEHDLYFCSLDDSHATKPKMLSRISVFSFIFFLCYYWLLFCFGLFYPLVLRVKPKVSCMLEILPNTELYIPNIIHLFVYIESLKYDFTKGLGLCLTAIFPFLPSKKLDLQAGNFRLS